MTEEDEAARQVKEQAMTERAPQLPERLKFRGMKEALESLYMRALNVESILDRIQAAMAFVSTMSDRLDMIEDDPTAKEHAKLLHNFVVGYRRPRYRRDITLSQDGVPAIVFESTGPEKTRHLVPFQLASQYDDRLTREDLEEHYIRDVLAWVTAAAELGRFYGFLRAEGDTLDFLTEEEVAGDEPDEGNDKEPEKEDDDQDEGDYIPEDDL